MSNCPLRLFVLLLALTAGGCQLGARSSDLAADAVSAPGSDPSAFTISSMRIQVIRPGTFVYVPLRSSFNELHGLESRIVSQIQKRSALGEIHPAGSVLFVCHDPSENPDQRFDVEIGVPVSEAGNLPAEFSVRPLKRFNCATVVYRGPLKFLPEAYDRLVRQMITAGLVPSEESRESYLKWKSPDSSENVVQIEIGIR